MYKWVNIHRDNISVTTVYLYINTGRGSDRHSTLHNTGELGYDGPLYDRFLHMTDDMLGPSPMHIKYRHMYKTDFAYDGPIFLVLLSPSYPSSPVCNFV